MTTTSKENRQRASLHEQQTYWDYYSGDSFYPPYDASFYVDDVEAYSGFDNPKWRSIIKNHGDATNYAHASRTTTVMQQGSFGFIETQMITIVPSPPDAPYDILGRVQTRTGYGQYVVVPLPVTSVIGTVDAVDIAKANFVSRCRSRMSPASGGVILGEIRETLRLIHHPAMAIRQSLSSYLGKVKSQHRNLKKIPKRTARGVVANTWLEYAFGWQPLLHDVEDAAHALADLTTKIPPNEEVSASGKTESDLGSYENYGGGGNQVFSYQIRSKEQASAQIYGAINRQVNPYPTFRSSFGLRPHDFLPTLWELIPYSFVADYFTNIGDMISCASFAESNLAWMGMSVVAKRVNESSSPVDVTDYQNIPGFQTQGGSISAGSMKRTYEEFTRIGAFSLVPSLHFRIPGSPKVAFNLAALFAQADGARFHR